MRMGWFSVVESAIKCIIGSSPEKEGSPFSENLPVNNHSKDTGLSHFGDSPVERKEYKFVPAPDYK